MTDSGRPQRTAFLLSQLGAFAASRFAQQLGPLGLTPAGAGILRIVSRSPGLSQRELAGRLGAAPSRVVTLVDELEGAGLVTRARNAADRRNYQLELTDDGRKAMAKLREAAERQNADVLGPLDDDERAKLAELVQRLAAAHGLDPDVHVGFAAAGRVPPEEQRD